MALNFLLKRSGTASKRPTAASMALGEVDLNYDSTTGGLYYKDSAGTVVKVGPAQVSTTAPNATPAGSSGNSQGEQWYDSTNGLLKTYNGTVWSNPVPNGSTTVVGILQLTDSTSSTSATTAATPNSVKTAYDLANAAIPKSTISGKGALISGSAASTPVTLTVGSNGQVLSANSATSSGLEWATPVTLSYSATKAVTNATPIDLLSWTGSVRMGDLTVMATDNATNVVWANITIASNTGAGSSVVVTSGGTFGTFSITAGGSGETIVTFTPSATLVAVDFVYKYTVSFGNQPSVL